MKKLLLISSLFFATISNAQFWTEGFGTGCNSGTQASGYVSSNGTWTVTSTGTNDSYADIWFVSSKCSNTGAANCAAGCSNSNNATLHVGNAAIPLVSVPADSAATYLTGVFCSSFAICSVTHKRVESPVINCSGHTGITISFVYIEGGEASDDDATLWYYDGTSWAQIDALAKTTVCASTSGIWTSFTTSLPASADNNPNVKIGFQWTNDNDSQGTDPSFAVDNISLSTIISSTEDNLLSEGYNAYYDGSNIIIQALSSYKVLSVINLLGEDVPFVVSGNSIRLKENAEGIYFLRIEIGKQVVTRKVQMLR